MLEMTVLWEFFLFVSSKTMEEILRGKHTRIHIEAEKTQHIFIKIRFQGKLIAF